MVDLDCDDSNVCTDDTCTAGACGYANNVASCDDGQFCNGTDTCAAGSCGSSGDPCLPGEFCNEATDVCDECVVDLDCDDANVCTDDTCTAGACGYTNNTVSCDDGQFCNGTDTCAAGSCASSGDPCLPGEFCNEATDVCDACVVDLDCDDSNVCTDDTCTAGACGYTNNTVSCDDGQFCNGTDTCAAGSYICCICHIVTLVRPD